MSQTTMNVEYVAKLARIDLSAQEIETYQNQLGSVLEHMDAIASLNLDGIEPTAHASPVFNVLRKDEIKPSLPVEDALSNAPKKANDLILMPKIVE